MSERDTTSGTAAADTTLEPVDAERAELPPLRKFNAFARYDASEPARDLIVALERSGIDGRYISAVELTDDASAETTPGDDPDREREAAIEEDNAFVREIAEDGAKGGGLGAVLGAIGGTAVALAIPGLGLAAGAGILAVSAGGAVAGVGVGTFAGAVSHTPASRSWERALVDLEHGQIVVGLHTDDQEMFDEGARIMEGASPESFRRLDEGGDPLP